ncbi:MAG: SulP family inorganic anion transporter, partial [Bacteroidota bacterium]
MIPGLTLGIILVPQAMAYGLLAGVDPVFGLYAALVPLAVYTLLASTPHVSVGPTALASLLCLNGLSGMADPQTPEYLGLAILLAALTGLIQLLFGLLRLGGITSLLSRPVLSGFVSAAAILIMCSQLDALLGIPTDRTTYLHQSLAELAKHAGAWEPATALFGLSSLLLLFAASRWLPAKFPTMLVLIILSTAVVWAAGEQWGIATIGEVPAGLPAFALPTLSWDLLLDLLPVAAVLALISFIETVSIGKAFNAKHKYYRIQPDRELVALGMSKIIGSFFQAIPTSASFSRSAVIESSGGRGPLGNVIAAFLLMLVLLFLTPLFYHLPITVLAAIIIFSVRKLFDFREMKRLSRIAPKE